jgi:perosamine synthetase
MLNAHPSLRLADLMLHRYRDPLRGLCEGQNVTTAFNARAALYRLCCALRQTEQQHRVVLLPAFHCTTVVDAVIRAGFRPVFYRIRPDLTIDYADLIAKTRLGVTAVLVIHYCGFPADLKPLLAERQSGAKWHLIEDWAHSFVDAATMQLTGGIGDFAVFSFYKLLPMQVGGGLRINVKDFSIDPASRRIGFRDGTVLTKRLFEQVVNNLGDGVIKRAYAKAERIRVARKLGARRTISPARAQTPESVAAAGVPDAQYAFSARQAETRLPWIARLVFGVSDLRSIATSRSTNYQSWSEYLIEQRGLEKIFPQLPGNVCPWAYPVRLPDRANWDQLLRAQNVPLFTFGETLHPTVHETDSATLRDALMLSRELLLLGVHQGLALEQIRRASTIVNWSLREPPVERIRTAFASTQC